MKTTIDIPDRLYRQAKIRAVEEGAALKDIVIRGLERELHRGAGTAAAVKPVPYFARRKLLPAFKKLQKSGALAPRPGDRDVTELISEDREIRYP